MFRLLRSILTNRDFRTYPIVVAPIPKLDAPHLPPKRSRLSTRRRRMLLVAGAWMVILVYLYCIPYAADKGGDFVHLWIGGYMVATGEIAQLYEPAAHKALLTQLALPLDIYWGGRYEILGVFFYPPLTGLLYSPLGALPLYWAQTAQAILNIGLGLLAAWLLSRILRGRLSFPAVTILLFTFPSFFYAYVLGQNGILTMTVVLAGWYALTQANPKRAGVYWSLLLFKPNWLFAVGWIPLVQRQWRMIGGIVGGLVALLLLTIGALGTAPLRAYLGVFAKLTDLHHLPQYPLESQYSILALFRRYLGMGTTADLVGWAVVAVLVGVTMWLTWSRQSAAAPHHNQTIEITALGLVAAVCLNPHLHHYDLLLVSVAGVVALSEWNLLKSRQRWLVIGLFLFHQFAFLFAELLQTSLPLPTIAMLALWGWLAVRVGLLGRWNPLTEPVQRSADSPLPRESQSLA